MLKELKKEANYTTTENGAMTYSSTMNDCLDLFATIGAMRHSSESEIIRRFSRAYIENPNIAVKILFYARDIRYGLGERRIFRTIIKYLANNHAVSVKKNIQYIAEYGRYDDLLELVGTVCEADMIETIEKQLKEDVHNLEEDKDISLLAKWLPSVNTSNKEKVKLGRQLANSLGMTEKEYRKTLSALRKRIDIIENHLREKAYDFDYSKQPGKAMFKYRAAFYRNDQDRYIEFLNKVNRGEATINAKTLEPYEIVRPLSFGNVTEEQKLSLNTMWEQLEDYEVDGDALAVIDTSGSMFWGVSPSPIEVAHSLGIYFAEHNKGKFANHFIMFSENPRLIEIKGEKLSDKVEYLNTFNEIANTNIQKMFELVLNTAVKNNLTQENMPKRLIIISDMEFDVCTEDADLTNFEYAKKIFEEAGYTLPKLVFWNVASRGLQVPVTMNEEGVTLVSGCTPKLFQQVMTDTTSPYLYMLEVVESDRYKNIVA